MRRCEKVNHPGDGGDLASPPLNDPLVPLANKTQFNAPELIFT